MNPIFLILGLVDTLAAGLIFYPIHEALYLYFMIYMIAKGGFFFINGIASKNITPCLTLSLIDIITGLLLGAISMGYSYDFFTILGMISVGKGLFCVILPFLY